MGMRRCWTPGLRTALLCSVMLILMAACGDGDDTTTTPIATGEPTTATALASATVTSPAATATPTPDLPPTHPPGTTAGIDVVDAIVAEILAEDVEAIRSRLLFVLRPCTADSEPGPMCPEGTAVGAEVPSFRLSGCSTNYEPDRADWTGPFPEGSAADQLALYAVYNVDQGGSAASEPAGAYGIVFAGSFAGITPDGPRMVDVRVDESGGIVGWWSSCGGMEPTAALDELPVGTLLLPPFGS